MLIIEEKVTPEFKKWVGYCEKQRASQLGTYDAPESYTAGAGRNNYTVFSKLYYEKTGIDIRGQAWCDSFVDAVFIHLFGVDDARKLLGGFSGYTPTSANYFKKMGQWHTSGPQEGDQIFFRNCSRIYHTGYVWKVEDGRVYTVEGNTSADSVLENEGGCVAQKSYSLSNGRIAGYGRPDYSIVETVTEGWKRAADGKRWWYQYRDGHYPTRWALLPARDGRHWYYFDSQGYMLTGWQWIGDAWYFLDTSEDSEGACWHAKEGNTGAMEVWTVE